MISNDMPMKIWGEITLIHSQTSTVLERISNFIQHFKTAVPSTTVAAAGAAAAAAADDDPADDNDDAEPSAGVLLVCFDLFASFFDAYYYFYQP